MTQKTFPIPWNTNASIYILCIFSYLHIWSFFIPSWCFDVFFVTVCYLDYVVRYCYKSLWISVSFACLCCILLFMFYHLYQQKVNLDRNLCILKNCSKHVSQLVFDTHLWFSVLVSAHGAMWKSSFWHPSNRANFVLCNGNTCSSSTTAHLHINLKTDATRSFCCVNRP